MISEYQKLIEFWILMKQIILYGTLWLVCILIAMTTIDQFHYAFGNIRMAVIVHFFFALYCLNIYI